MSEYKHGSMDCSAQEKAFAGFISFSTKVCIAVVVLFVFLAIFAT